MILADFFQLTPNPANCLYGTFDIRLVILSYAVAIFASYIALDIAGRLRDVDATAMINKLWIVGGAVAMGAGIWAMHFIGMLAFNMPDVPLYYDPFWTGLSMVVATVAAGFALILLNVSNIKMSHLIVGGVILGIGIVSMHYTGMEAMTYSMSIHYQPGLFILSILIAVFASEAALWLAIKSNEVVISKRFRMKFVSAFIMGAAICGMHYTGMFAAVFTPLAQPVIEKVALNPPLLAMMIAGVTIVIMGIAFFVSSYKEAMNEQLLASAHQAGMTEVATSVLHNVGNALNSVKVSASLVAEKTAKSKLNTLEDVNKLIAANRNNLGAYLTSDPHGAELPNYLQLLSACWAKEQNDIANETQNLISHIEHIKKIISTQQDLSRTRDFEQMVSLEEVIEESLLICGVANSADSIITVEKNYENLKPLLIHKVKLLQILVNLIKNAKDALIASARSDKRLTLKIAKSKHDKCIVQVIDNGVGIAKDNLTQIFFYGFTTKHDGHGFGLHSCALTARDMGGTIKVVSEGKDKGATFTLELPYKQRREKSV